MNERKNGSYANHIWRSVEGNQGTSYQQLRVVNDDLQVTYTKILVPENQAASADKISSSAHHRGESLGVASSGDMSMTCFNI